MASNVEATRNLRLTRSMRTFSRCKRVGVVSAVSSSRTVVPVESNLTIAPIQSTLRPMAAVVKLRQNGRHHEFRTQIVTMNRREKIEQMLESDPDDQFLQYSLAMELRKEGQHEASLNLLGRLTNNSPPMVPAFFMAAQQLVDLDRVDEARERLRAGIDEARNQGDTHAAGEMSEFLASLGDLGEL